MGKTKKNLQKGLSSAYVYQIYDRLMVLNDFAENWENGEFNLEEFKSNNNIVCSPESQSTINLYGEQRTFSIPHVGSKVFTLHIKTGDLRFHFFPDNNTKMIYVGYIGPHLNIATR